MEPFLSRPLLARVFNGLRPQDLLRSQDRLRDLTLARESLFPRFDIHTGCSRTVRDVTCFLVHAVFTTWTPDDGANSINSIITHMSISWDMVPPADTMSTFNSLTDVHVALHDALERHVVDFDSLLTDGAWLERDFCATGSFDIICDDVAFWDLLVLSLSKLSAVIFSLMLRSSFRLVFLTRPSLQGARHHVQITRLRVQPVRLFVEVTPHHGAHRVELCKPTALPGSA